MTGISPLIDPRWGADNLGGASAAVGNASALKNAAARDNFDSAEASIRTISVQDFHRAPPAGDLFRMENRRRTSFSSGPPRYLICRDRRPVAAVAVNESAAEAAQALASRYPGTSVTIYEIATGIHVEVVTRGPVGGRR
jgi:hypothetical protein